MPLTPEERAQFKAAREKNMQRSSAGGRMMGDREVVIPEDEAGIGDMEIGDVVSMAQNAPDVISDNVQMLKTLFTSTDAAKEIGSFLLGVPGDIYDEATTLGEAETKTGALASETIKKFSPSRLRKTLVEEPDEILNLIGLVAAPARIAGKRTITEIVGRELREGAKRGVKGAMKVRPIALAVGKAGETAVDVKDSIKDFVTWLPTYPTGVDAQAFRIAYGSGREGKHSMAYKAFKDGQININDDQVEKLADTLMEQTDLMKKEAADAYKEDMKRLVLKEDLSTEDMLQESLQALYENHNIRTVMKVDKDQKSIEQLRILFEPRKRNAAKETGSTLELLEGDQATLRKIVGHLHEVYKRGNNSIEAMHNLRRNLDNVVYSARLNGETQAEAAAKSIRETVRRQLSERVQGYDEAMKNYTEAADFMEEVAAAFNTRGKKETIMGAMSRALTKRPNKERQTRILKALDARFGNNLQESIAGINTAEVVGQGLVARGAGATTLLTGASMNPAFLIGLPFTMPRVVGSFLAGLGVKVGQAEKVMEKIWAEAGKRPGLITEGLSYAEVLERLQMSDEELQLLQDEEAAKKKLRETLEARGLPQLAPQGSGNRNGQREVMSMFQSRNQT